MKERESLKKFDILIQFIPLNDRKLRKLRISEKELPLFHGKRIFYLALLLLLCTSLQHAFFLKMCHPRPHFHFIFGLFKQTLQFLQQYDVKKCPSSFWCWDSNP